MNSTDQRLIELVEKCSHLYDKHSSDYKDKIKAQNAWCSIARLLNSTAADCEHRWGQLRERFTRERRTLKVGLPSGSGSSKQPTPSNLYKALQFLEPHVQSRRTRGNILQRSLSPAEDSVTWDMQEDLDVFEYLKSVDDKTKLEIKINNELQQSKEDVSKEVEPSDENNANLQNIKPLALDEMFADIRNKKTKNIVSVGDDPLQVVSEALQSVKGLCESTDKSDDVAYNFCMTIYSQLKNMSKKKQKVARTKINTIMVELESDSE